MSHVLFATPYRATTNPTLLARAHAIREVAIRAAEASGYTVTVADFMDTNSQQQEDVPFAGHARVRNALLAQYLDPAHDLVLWMDADLVLYPADIIARLDAVRDGGVAAPFVYVEGWLEPDRMTRRRAPVFYDIRGFVEQHGFAENTAPYFVQEGDVLTMRCVGCCYLIPASLYHNGVRYVPEPPYTEHMSVMRAVQDAGLPITAHRKIEAWHAYLPHYGETWHTGHE